MGSYVFIISILLLLSLLVILRLAWSGEKKVIPSKIKIIHDPEWLKNIAVEVQCYTRIEPYIEKKNKWLGTLAIPIPEYDPGSASIDDLLDELQSVLDPKRLIDPIQSLHVNGIPLRNIRRYKTNDKALILIRDTLKHHVPRASWIIQRAWKKTRRYKQKQEAFTAAIFSFLQKLEQSSKKTTPTNQKLKDFFANALSSVVIGEASKGKEPLHISLNSIPVEHTSWKNNLTSSITWQALKYGLTAQAVYKVNYENTSLGMDPNEIAGPASLDEDNYIPIIDTLDNFEWDATIIINLPITSIILNTNKNIQLVRKNILTRTEAVQDILFKTTVRGGRVFLGAWFSKIITKALGASQEAYSFLAIFTIYFTRKLSREAIKKWNKNRYKKALKEYEEGQLRREQEIEEAYFDYYESMYDMMQDLKESMAEDYHKLTLKPLDSSLIETNITKLKDWLLKDIALAEQWKFNTLHKPLSRKHQGMNDFIIMAKALIQKLSEKTITDYPKIIYNFRTIPLLKNGYLWIHRKEMLRSLRYLNGEKNIGFICWTYALQGIYYHALTEILKENQYQGERIDDLQNHWAYKLEMLRRKVLFHKSRVEKDNR